MSSPNVKITLAVFLLFMAKSTPPCEILEMSKDCVHIAPRGKSSAGNILPSNNRIWPGKNSSNSAILPHEAK